MVVLLAIAGAVAAVLLTRAGEETTRLEEETTRWSEIGNETGCGIAGGVWSNPGGSGSCGAPGTVAHNPTTDHTNYHVCHGTSGGSPAHTHSWMDDDTDNDNDPETSPAGVTPGEDGSCSPGA